MDNLIQYLIVFAIVLTALAYMIKRLRSNLNAKKGGACGCGCGGCPETRASAAGSIEDGGQINKKGK